MIRVQKMAGAAILISASLGFGGVAQASDSSADNDVPSYSDNAGPGHAIGYSAGTSIEAFTKVVAGVAGVVLAVPGAIGTLSADASSRSLDYSSAPLSPANRAIATTPNAATTPLALDAEVYTVGVPPNQALRKP
jgi:hypothetical protein